MSRSQSLEVEHEQAEVGRAGGHKGAKGRLKATGEMARGIGHITDGRLQETGDGEREETMIGCCSVIVSELLDEVWGIWEASGPRYKDLQGLDPSDLFGSPHAHITSLLPHGTPLMTYHDS